MAGPRTSCPCTSRRPGIDITIDDGTVTARMPRARIVADVPIPGVPRILRLPDGERIETSDHAARCVNCGPSTSSSPARRTRSSRGGGRRSPGLPLQRPVSGSWSTFALPLAADPVATTHQPGGRALSRQAGPCHARHDGSQAFEHSPDDAQKPWNEKFDAFVAGEKGEEEYSASSFRHAGFPNAFALPGRHDRGHRRDGAPRSTPTTSSSPCSPTRSATCAGGTRCGSCCSIPASPCC